MYDCENEYLGARISMYGCEIEYVGGARMCLCVCVCVKTSVRWSEWVCGCENECLDGTVSV